MVKPKPYTMKKLALVFFLVLPWCFSFSQEFDIDGNELAIRREFRNFSNKFDLKGQLVLDEFWTFYDLKDYKNALAKINIFIELNPNSHEAYINRGIVYRILEKYDLALFNFDKSLKIYPNNIDSYQSRGLLYMLNKNYEKAISDFDKVVEINNKYYQGYLNRAVANSRMNFYISAMEDLETAISLNPKCDLCYLNRSIINSKLGNRNEIIKDINKAIEINPIYGYSYFCKATYFLSVRDTLEACKNFEISYHLDYIKANESILKYCSKFNSTSN